MKKNKSFLSNKNWLIFGAKNITSLYFHFQSLFLQDLQSMTKIATKRVDAFLPQKTFLLWKKVFWDNHSFTKILRPLLLPTISVLCGDLILPLGLQDETKGISFNRYLHQHEIANSFLELKTKWLLLAPEMSVTFTFIFLAFSHKIW